ncbi:receptor-interacting serine/threonine-protein kinase 3-like [Sander lucioperca]|uniref:receptor-interacting serine/threonine-protein kinase 3-like n=1 Tax=Sander lucioperca TaxID=283035 RepID=UPI001653565F|nr:receptor-interacting serine/threonine-protein kinase 3-like [Sander lucioperca]
MAQFVEDSILEDWEEIGSGGFGEIYKARHHQWGADVAIKLLLQGEGTEKSLLHEIDMMRQATSPHVMAVRGVFKGQTPSGRSTQLGLVMEVMERGSLAFLQEALRGTPPWPLVFRLAHQVALGINYLHSLPRPVLHQDLKPQNVLLDDALNAKLTDFGLSRISCSVTLSKNGEPLGGTINYMPPEAFENISYEPTRAFDIYSYGILLWSTVTGKQPYANSCELTLDINTVNTNLKLSDNNRKMTCVEEFEPYPDHPEKFDWPQLLCRDGLTGLYYWEVETRGGGVSVAVLPGVEAT